MGSGWNVPEPTIERLPALGDDQSVQVCLVGIVVETVRSISAFVQADSCIAFASLALWMPPAPGAMSGTPPRMYPAKFRSSSASCLSRAGDNGDYRTPCMAKFRSSSASCLRSWGSGLARWLNIIANRDSGCWAATASSAPTSWCIPRPAFLAWYGCHWAASQPIPGGHGPRPGACRIRHCSRLAGSGWQSASAVRRSRRPGHRRSS